MDSNRKWVLQAWLDNLCQMLPEVQRAVVITDPELTADLTPAVGWPDAAIESADLCIAAKLASNRNSPVFNVQQQATTAGERAEVMVAYPLSIKGELTAVASLSMIASPKQQDVIVQLLKWGESWLQLILLQPDSDVKPRRSDISMLQACLKSNSVRSAANAVTTQLASSLDCQRVSLGLVDGEETRLEGLSNSPDFDPRTLLVHRIEEVMTETRMLGSVINFRKDQPQDDPSLNSHRQLAQKHEVEFICSLPMVVDDQIIGVLVLERNSRPFSATNPVIDPLQFGLLSNLFALKQKLARGPLATVKSRLDEFAGRLLGTGSLRLKLTAIAVLLAGLFIALVPGEFRVSAPAVLEGRVQRAIVAPFDGFVATARARAGDLVKKDEVIAELDDSDLRLEQQRWLRQRDEHIKQYRNALAKLDHSAARIAQSEVAQTDAQLDLIASQLQRAKMISPLDGVIISGDLSRLLGVPIEKGQLLFEVAPLNEYRLILQVDERDITHVHQGQTGTLTLTAFSQREIPFTIQRVAALYQQEDAAITYRTEATLETDITDLRPGMQGIGKIYVRDSNYLWIWTHKVADWVRLRMWAWLP